MALIKAESTDYGVEASYWKVSMISIDRIRGFGSFSLMLYKDKESSKLNPDKYFKDTVYYIDNEQYPGVFENMKIDLYSIAYDYIKVVDEYFKDAVSDND